MIRYSVIPNKNPREILLLRGFGCGWRRLQESIIILRSLTFVENETKLKPDKTVVQQFISQVMPRYIMNDRVDILLNNTDFGVGGEKTDHV